MPKHNSTQGTPYSLSENEVRLVNAFRKFYGDDIGYFLELSERTAARSAKPNPLRLVPDYDVSKKLGNTNALESMNADQAELLRSYDGMHPEDKLLIRDFAKARCIENGSTKRPALGLVHD